jgi:hypothetical protein
MHFNPIYSLIAAVVILFIPTVWELWNDRNGEDARGKRMDWIARFLIAFLSAYISELIRTFELPIVGNLLAAMIMIVAIHLLLFDYAVVIIMKKRSVLHPQTDAFSYLGETANYPKWWIKAGQWGRFAIRVAVFTAALIIYF